MTGYRSFVAIGDSFTEGMNDERPDGTYRGWADRLAEILADGSADFAYANLAIRGKMLTEIMTEQLPVALETKPDLVTVCAGGNDIIVPGADVDAKAAEFEAGIEALRAAGIEVLIFTGPDTKSMSVINMLRGKVAIYNAHLRAIADRHDTKLVDLWSMDTLHDIRAWSDDRLHFTPEAHRRIALRTAEVLDVPTAEDWREPWPETDGDPNWLTLRRSDLEWTRAHLLPWIRRQLRGESLGDGITPKRPRLAPLRDSAASAQLCQQVGATTSASITAATTTAPPPATTTTATTPSAATRSTLIDPSEN
ncbi:Lysophospholipase L1 [Prauserella alba]|uniref:SGNH/GDSL hydrolase family protein n=2 Tax=Prauserella alba TaxID=176898 RepID=A0ABP4FTP7_9PSEU|nr:SGNH/GDSL hydrolase family protein [Prauserella alba]MCP2181525.1 Lysophospholipase L1 [Prauserella alba]